MSAPSYALAQTYKHKMGYLKYCLVCSHLIRPVIADKKERREHMKATIEWNVQRTKNAIVDGDELKEVNDIWPKKFWDVIKVEEGEEKY